MDFFGAKLQNKIENSFRLFHKLSRSVHFQRCGMLMSVRKLLVLGRNRAVIDNMDKKSPFLQFDKYVWKNIIIYSFCLLKYVYLQPEIVLLSLLQGKWGHFAVGHEYSEE